MAMKKYKKKDPYKRPTINLGLPDDPVRIVFEKKVKKGCNQSEMLREAVMVMWGDNPDFRDLKAERLGKRVLRLRDEIRLLMDDLNNSHKEMIKMGLTIDEVRDFSGEEPILSLIKEAMSEMKSELSEEEKRAIDF
jgi:hypothetical protein